MAPIRIPNQKISGMPQDITINKDLFNGAKLCFENAEELLTSSKILLKKKKYGAASSGQFLLMLLNDLRVLIPDAITLVVKNS